MKLLPLGADELVALILLGLTLLPTGIGLLDMLQWWIIAYLFMCAIFRKYEASRQKDRH